MAPPTQLRCITYMTPGLPLDLFQTLVDGLSDALSISTTLVAESRFSGPPRGNDNPFLNGTAELGWMCTPSYFWSQQPNGPSAQLVPAAMVLRDHRNQGQPYYHSDVIVNRESKISEFSQLRGHRWTYNDLCSQSGYYNLLQQLAELDEDLSFLGSVSASGSHAESLRQVAEGQSDAASIDSNVLAHQLELNPALRESIRVIASWGPHSIQPLVAASHVELDLRERVANALLELHTHPLYGDRSRHFGIERFVSVDDSFYEAERAALEAGESMLRHCSEPPEGGDQSARPGLRTER